MMKQQYNGFCGDFFLGWRPAMVALAAFAGLALGACRQSDADDDDDDSAATLEVRNACADYCAMAKVCNDNVDEENCYEGCLDNMTNCQVDEQAEALDKLRECADESCNDFLGCTIEVGAQCYFGL